MNPYLLQGFAILVLAICVMAGVVIGWIIRDKRTEVRRGMPTPNPEPLPKLGGRIIVDVLDAQRKIEKWN